MGDTVGTGVVVVGSSVCVGVGGVVGKCEAGVGESVGRLVDVGESVGKFVASGVGESVDVFVD